MVSAMPSSRTSPSSVKPNHSQVKDPLSVKATERVRRRAYELMNFAVAVTVWPWMIGFRLKLNYA